MTKIKSILYLVLLRLTVLSAYAQTDILLEEPLKIQAKEKITAEIKKGDILIASSVSNDDGTDFPIISLVARKQDGRSIYIDIEKIRLFEFLDIDNVNKVWEKNLLINGTYTNLLKNGLQYSLRNDLNNDAIEYINTNSSNNRFFDDEYFEDYLHTLANKIHLGILKDKRPGNLFFKIIRDPFPNAYSLPNGCIILTTGLLSTIQSEDELIGVLSHEIAHFVLDHQILNYNKEIDRKNRAEFWSSFATIAAAGADAYLAINNPNHIPGILTISTAIATSAIASEVTKRLGIQYNQQQEMEADKAAQEISQLLSYRKSGLAVALTRVKNYCTLTGNYLALFGNGSHPSLDSRIEALGVPESIEPFEQTSYLKKVSFITSYNAQFEMELAHYLAANELVSKNINHDVGTATDYMIKAIVKRKLLNTTESNEDVLSLLNKAKEVSQKIPIQIYKEESITLLRLNRKNDAKKAMQTYISALATVQEKKILKLSDKYILALEEEISWAEKMLTKIDHL